MSNQTWEGRQQSKPFHCYFQTPPHWFVHTSTHTQKCLFLFPADPIWNIYRTCSRLQSPSLPEMDTEANTVLWKWSHHGTMQGSWPRGPGSHKSVCYSGGLTHDLSNTRPVLTVIQVFIIIWPLNISQTKTAQIKSCDHQPWTFLFFSFIQVDISFGCLKTTIIYRQLADKRKYY